MPNTKNSPTNLQRREKARRAVDLRVSGLTWQQIADELGYKDQATPRGMVDNYFATHARETHREMYPLLQARGELMWKNSLIRVNTAVRDGDIDVWDKAMRHAEKALEFLAKMNGLDGGPSVQVNIGGGGDLEALRSQFFDAAGVSSPEVVEHEEPGVAD